jgi:hypothetical protein
MLGAVNAREKAHSAQASQAPRRWFIPPAARSRCLVLSVTTPLYNTAASNALRKEPSRTRNAREKSETGRYRLLVGPRKTISQHQLPGLAYQIMPKAMVRLLVNQLKAHPFVDPTGGVQHVVRPQRDL